MAITKWLDPNVDWLDEEKGAIIRAAWDAIRQASDERNAYYNETHEAGFAASETWPDFTQWLLKFRDNPNPTNWATVMESALQYQEGTAEDGTVDPSSITTSGAPSFPGSFYDLLSTQLVLDDEGWPAVGGQRLLHMLNSDSGAEAGLITKEWLKQWYQVLNFNVYLRSLIMNGGFGKYMSDVEEFYIGIDIDYTWTSGVFDSATAFVTNPKGNTPVDIYISGDLPQATKATYQDLMDYAQSIFDSYFTDDTKWVVSIGTSEQPISNKAGTEADLVGNGTFSFNILYKATRFKREQGYRPANLQRFDQPVFWNGYFLKSGTGTQGTSEISNEVILRELEEDGTSLWIYHAILDDQGSTPFAAPDFTSGYSDVSWSKITLNDDNVLQETVLFRPNLEDGTGFEYYTPAP